MLCASSLCDDLHEDKMDVIHTRMLLAVVSNLRMHLNTQPLHYSSTKPLFPNLLHAIQIQSRWIAGGSRSICDHPA